MPEVKLNKLAAPNSYEMVFRADNWVTVRAHLIIPEDANTRLYPVILFGHGAGEAGTNLSKIYNSSAGGPAYFNTQNKWPGGFIVITPQAGTWSPSAYFFQEILTWVIQNYKVNESRIYWMGLSAAGTAMMEYNLATNITPKFPIAAYVVMAVVVSEYDIKKGKKIAEDNTHWWGLYDLNDGNGRMTQDWKRAIDNNKPGLTKETLHNEGHSGWYRFNPEWKDPITGLNFYEWAMQYNSGSTVVTPPVIIPPVIVPPTKKITAIITVYNDGTFDTEKK